MCEFLQQGPREAAPATVPRRQDHRRRRLVRDDLRDLRLRRQSQALRWWRRRRIPLRRRRRRRPALRPCHRRRRRDDGLRGDDPRRGQGLCCCCFERPCLRGDDLRPDGHCGFVGPRRRRRQGRNSARARSVEPRGDQGPPGPPRGDHRPDLRPRRPDPRRRRRRPRHQTVRRPRLLRDSPVALALPHLESHSTRLETRLQVPRLHGQRRIHLRLERRQTLRPARQVRIHAQGRRHRPRLARSRLPPLRRQRRQRPQVETPLGLRRSFLYMALPTSIANERTNEGPRPTNKETHSQQKTNKQTHFITPPSVRPSIRLSPTTRTHPTIQRPRCLTALVVAGVRTSQAKPAAARLLNWRSILRGSIAQQQRTPSESGEERCLLLL
mmetsp:Transcript_16274/g.52991  ORF Transcript_16274/g.52991 Transcript_16274/m.52991 type:complete len:383 (-) Transcript_16274:26-1174(-)